MKLLGKTAKQASIFRKIPALVCTFMLMLEQLNGAGVAAIKEQAFHNDSSAKPLVFSEIKDEGAPFLIFQVKGKRVTIDKAKIAAVVEVPSAIPNQILDENGISPLRAFLKDMSAFTKRFPQMESILSNHIITVRNQIESFDSGKLRVDGLWITEEAYKNQVAANQLETINVDKSNKEKLTTLSKKDYHGYKKVDADIEGVKITHNEGVAKITWDDIPDTLKIQLGYDEVVKAENDKKLAAKNRENKLRAELDELVKEAKTPISDWRALKLCEQFTKIKKELGEMDSDGLTTYHIMSLFGRPDSTSEVSDAIRNHLSSLPGDLAAILDGREKPIGVWDDATIWSYNSRLKNTTTEKLQTLRIMFTSKDRKLAGVRKENESGYYRYDSE